jgi:glycosyltransferase involved in cell wall biosynthesis
MRRIPLVMSVQDLFPETLIAQSRAGKFQTFYYKPLRWLDKKIKQNCAAIIVISEKFREIYIKDRNIQAQKVHLIPNWIDQPQSNIGVDAYSIRHRYNIPTNAFLVIYAGNISFASGLDNVILAFQKLIPQTSIYLLIAGDGSMLANHRELARKIDNPRIIFHNPWLECETSNLLAAANVFILPTQGEQSMFSVPSKLISYMFAGRPILSCVEEKSEVARVINAARCGWTIPVANLETISQKLVLLSQYSQEELDEYGKRGRAYAVKEMTKMSNLPKLKKLMERVANDM